MTDRPPPAGRLGWAAATIAVAFWGALVGSLPLIGGAPAGDDAYYHAMRAQQHARCWRAGVFFPRWYPDLNGGLGGPEPRAYPIVPLVVHAAFALTLDDAVAAISVATACVPVLAGLAMLFVARRRGALPGVGVLAGAVWATSPYLVIALHERVALAECWTLALLPWVLHTFLPPTPSGRRGIVRGAVAFGVTLACQLPLALMVAIMVAAWHLLAAPRGPKAAMAAGGLGSAVAAMSWLPNLVAVQYLAGERLVDEGYRWEAHLLPGPAGGDAVLGWHLTLALGGILAAVVILALRGGAGVRSLAGAGMATALLATPLAAWAYRWIPGLAWLQFPWRWLGVGTCLATLGLVAVRSHLLRTAAALLLLLPLATSAAWRWRLPDGPALRPSDPAPRAAAAAMRFGVPPILPSLPAYLPRGVDLARALRAAPAASAGAVVADLTGPSRWRFTLLRNGPGEATLPLLAAPGWEAEVDDRRVGSGEREGLLSVPVPVGRHVVTVAQVLRPEDHVGVLLSTVGMLSLIALARSRDPDNGGARLPGIR